MRKEKILIISPMDEGCGIRHHALMLQKSLRQQFETVDIIENNRSVILKTMNVSEVIEKQIPNYDAVILQLETTSQKLVDRIIATTKKYNKKLIVTVHSMIMPKNKSMLIHRVLFFLSLIRKKKDKKIDIKRSIANLLLIKSLQKYDNIHLVFHREDYAVAVQKIFQLKNVYHHPVCLFGKEEIDFYQSLDEKEIRKEFNIPLDKKIICFSGYLTAYKGFETLLKAFSLLINYGHSDYHLVINSSLPEYERSLKSSDYLNKINGIIESNLKSGVNILNNITYANCLNDHDFFKVITISNIMIFPYLETNQHASGPLSHAFSLNKYGNIFTTHIEQFIQFEKYYPKAVTFFDCNNHIELYKKILDANVSKIDNLKDGLLNYNSKTHFDLYTKIILDKQS
jgi:glycosyltransferase involved in cell wall biosynthesis